jgi:hypothetical protein
MTINLSQLAQLQELFKKLSSGAHLNRLQDTELWIELESYHDKYEALFAALGFVLVLDGRGFAYFKTDQATSYTGKLTRRLALLLMLLFEYQADQGLHLFQFQQWRIDMSLIDKLWQQYHVILEAEEMTSSQMLKEILDSAARVGFLVFEDEAYGLLPAVHRYLDLFQELAQAECLDQAQAETTGAFFREETEEELL